MLNFCVSVQNYRSVQNYYTVYYLSTPTNHHEELEGKIAVITGGSSGIGFATAQRFAIEGAHVFITGRRQSELDEAVTEIGEKSTGVTQSLKS